MKKLPILLALSMIFVALPFVEAKKPKKELTPIQATMKDIDRDWAKIRRMLKDGENNLDYHAVLLILSRIKNNMMDVSKLTPPSAEKLTGDKKIKFMVGYRSAMRTNISMVADIEKFYSMKNQRLAEGATNRFKRSFKAVRKTYGI